MSIRDNYLAIMENIASACAAAGRSVEDVKLIAVSKFMPIEKIDEAVQAGVKSVGENRAQELRDKLSFFTEKGLDVHLIGQLQTNKVKYVTGNVSLIQSVDRVELAKEISRLAQQRNVVQNILIEVNVGEENQKGGVPKEELLPLLEVISAMPNIGVKGLMCIPPAVGEDEVRRYFASMRRLFDDLSHTGLPNVEMQQLSMGMSGDYKSAIMEGATMVRVGRALFGERPLAVGKA